MFDINHIAKLARIGLSEEEKKQFSKELEAILDFVKKLNELNTDKIEPIGHITGLLNETRDDERKKETITEEEAKRAEKMLNMAPDQKDEYFKVKAIL